MRHAEIKMTYEGKNITKAVQSDLLSFSYVESAEGQADTLAIEIQDKKRKWIGSWFPSGGDKIAASVTAYDWAKKGEKKTLNCGVMYIDSPEFSGPPLTLSLGAISIPANKGFNDTARSRSWKKATLKQIGQKIADYYGMSFLYDAPKNFTVSALSQSDETDSDFLTNTAKKYNMCLKVFSSKLVLYSKARYEARTPAATIKYGSSNISEYKFSAPTVDTGYNAVKLTYTLSKSDKDYTYTYRVASGGKTLLTDESVDDEGQAETVAKAALREANESQYTGSMTLALNFSIVAGCTVKISGFGKFDGKYFVDSAEHSCGSGAGVTEIEIHKCLGGDY